jgi:hypothetical protein
MTKNSVELVETVISSDILDTIGKSFKFRHGSGTVEWLKNSLDQYLRLRKLRRERLRGNWPVLVNLIDAPTARSGPNLAVIDFGGSSLNDIKDFFLVWGLRSAATHGRAVEASVTGGHGNGGKFYMREMWKDGARFLTFFDGRASALVLQRRTDGKSGYWEFRDKSCSWRQAIALAMPQSEGLGGSEWAENYLQAKLPAVVADLDAGHRGLSVIVGRRAIQVLSSNDVVRGGRWDSQRLVDAIRDAPQARRPVRELAITIFRNGTPAVDRLAPEAIAPDPNWTTKTLDVPVDLLRDAGFKSADQTIGRLTLTKAAVPLTGRLRERNSILVLDGADNPIASYALRALPIPGHSPLLEFFNGDLALTFDGLDRLVQNDREQLVNTSTTHALLDWVANRLWDECRQIEESRRAAAKRSDLEIAAILNDQLNEHAKRFLEELQTQIFVDIVTTEEGGGPGKVAGPGDGKGGRGTGGQGSGGTQEIPGSTEARRRPRFPQVLLSGHDGDPSKDFKETKYLTDRHPPLDQDDVDRKYNVWWINTEHPFARATMEHGGPKGVPFKSYQLHMFRDVVQREALRYRQRREAELSLDRVENELADVSNRFLAELPHDVVSSILETSDGT